MTAAAHDETSPALPASMRQLWARMARRRKLQLGALLVLMLSSAVAEVVSIGAIIPFLAVLVSPQQVLQLPMLQGLASRLPLDGMQHATGWIAALFAASAASAAVLRIALLYTSTRVGFAIGADLGAEIYRRTLYQPYHVHVARNSSELIGAITAKVDMVVSGVIVGTLTMVSNLILVVALMAVLLSIDARAAVVAGASLGCCYMLLARLTRAPLRRNSERIASGQVRVIKTLQEGFGGIRDVLLDGSQEIYWNEFRSADRPLRRAQAMNTFLAHSPRYAIEGAAMVVVALIALAMSRSAGGLQATVPTLGALALGAQRLLPAMQQAYSARAMLHGNRESLRNVLQLLEQRVLPELTADAPAALPFEREIAFRHVSFGYPGTERAVLTDVDLRFARGAMVGLVGTTGSGKSTFVDLLIALATPTDGDVQVDGVPVRNGAAKAWQRRIAHVPQHIHIADASIESNIAFGVPAGRIDAARVRWAAATAHATEFIEQQPQGWATLVGERGARLSGGQRQRIGIARALYKQADVLVLDEATSALDEATEARVLRDIRRLPGGVTIFMVTHRPATLTGCTDIVSFESGRARQVGATPLPHGAATQAPSA